MIKIENIVMPSSEQWKAIIMGTRNPMNSWEKSDSFVCEEKVMTNEEIDARCGVCPKHENCDIYDREPHTIIGPNDHKLMTSLAKGGPVHAKYRRMINVYVDITAPLYWWKEFDTYKVGTVANSCSTMHKIHAKEFTLEDFSCEQLISKQDEGLAAYTEVQEHDGYLVGWSPKGVLELTIDALNTSRDAYLRTKDKKYWWQMIQLLPTSYNQKRTVMLNYEVLVNIYESRKHHKLDCWRDFCSWIETLPYSELITGEKECENNGEN